ncbi:unnamed protein product [Tetraodon nigroviridis]|uniref:E3 ubiquitin-protein ligase RNF182 n=1 Tax=Tetraodon nigroviridis TaxID=99883 RepID=Q4TAB7_TETNG|nr:unnamed protein product [Tetraodon nigroviridis]
MTHLKEAEPCSQGEAKVQTWSRSLVYTLEELECKICYNGYDSHSRKPKLLGCLHRVCAQCLKKMVTTGESSSSTVTCPFCRQETHVPEDEVWLVEDDRNLLAVLSCRNQICRIGGEAEVLLNPNGLAGGGAKALASSHCSSDCLLITVMELPDESSSSDSLSMLNVVGLYRPPSLDSLPWNLSRLKCRYHNLPRCLLGALCLEHPVMTRRTKMLHLQELMSIHNQTEPSDEDAPAYVDAAPYYDDCGDVCHHPATGNSDGIKVGTQISAHWHLILC